MSNGLAGYNRILRVDMTAGRCEAETLDESTLRRYIGGTGIGAKFLYDEVPPGIDWSHPENRLSLATGPLGGTQVPGSGTFSVVTKGALTNGATATQANGFFGAYLKFSGFDGIVIRGAAEKLLYLYVHDGVAELRDAGHLAGMDTTETEQAIKSELGYTESSMSVFCIGPAGENLVRYACIVGDKGHAAAHNGVGAVMGSKRLKAIAVARGKNRTPLHDEPHFLELTKTMRERIRQDPWYSAGGVKLWGTLNVYPGVMKRGSLPAKNYTTNVYDEEALAKFSGQYIREHYSPKKLHPCWGCPMYHCHTLTIPDGPHAGESIEEPEYEGLASWSSQIGQTDLTKSMILSELVDRLGMDTNESSWTVGMVMECYEKGILTKADTDGLEMTWGNLEATETLLNKMARREGFGDLLAEGVMRAAQRIGKGAENFAIHTKKGNTPRSHDHRNGWREMFDTCVSNTGTLEAAWQIAAPNLKELDIAPLADQFSPLDVSTYVARMKGGMLFEDSLGTCAFCTQGGVKILSEMVSAATGWDFTMAEGLKVGFRVANLLRVFNLRHGIPAEMDAPSPRYGSVTTDGPHAGKDISPHWKEMLSNYYGLMGWDTTGKPLPETLENLGLGHITKDIR